jgi:hypothetical protein
MKVLIYSGEITSRLEYAAKILLQNILGLEISFITDNKEFLKADGAKINYSKENIPDSLHILPASILFENSIYNVDPLFNHWENLPVLFFNAQNKEFPFDPFAAAFWMVTRYEEYLPFEADKHGRFRASISLALREGFLTEPVVHNWAEVFAKAIKKQFPEFTPVKRKFSSLSTIDVDSAWIYLHKGFIRTVGAFAKALLSGKTPEVSARWKTIRGLIKDPFDSYEKLDKIHQALNIVPQWFFLLADYGRYDCNINPRNNDFQNLIRGIAAHSSIGMHPSYNSEKSIKIQLKEKKRLEKILNSIVIRSRQHFLKLSFPESYRRLVSLGIHEDYTMGFHDQPGFRAGLCTPFPWFDLTSNREENLIIVPFMLMDRTFTEYLHISTDEAFKIIVSIIDKTVNIQGQFVSIWHNEPPDRSNADAWFDVYKKMQSYIVETITNNN